MEPKTLVTRAINLLTDAHVPSSTEDRIQGLVCGNICLATELCIQPQRGVWGVSLETCFRADAGELQSSVSVPFLAGCHFHLRIRCCSWKVRSTDMTCRVSGRKEEGNHSEALMFFTEAWKEWRVCTEIAKENRTDWAPPCQLPLHSCLECCSPRYQGQLPHLCGAASLTWLFSIAIPTLLQHSLCCYLKLVPSLFFLLQVDLPSNEYALSICTYFAYALFPTPLPKH